MAKKPTVAIHKFSSCDGCQLAFLNLGEDLLTLSHLIEIRHFAEAGTWSPEDEVDIAFVEGSISTADEQARIERIRAQSRYLITIGACATAGGLQALRNLHDSEPEWRKAIYAKPEFIKTLANSRPVATRVKVDLELWGCPVSSRQVIAAVRDLLFRVTPAFPEEKLCLECKRKQVVCTLVTQRKPCMGPVTQSGCGALCPSFGRACYACYGPGENSNTEALSNRFKGFGLMPREVAQHFLFINSGAKLFNQAGESVYPAGLYRDDERH